MIALLFLFWLFQIKALAGPLSYDEIKKTMPWLGRLTDQNEQVRAIVQNSLPSGGGLVRVRTFLESAAGRLVSLLCGTEVEARGGRSKYSHEVGCRWCGSLPRPARARWRSSFLSRDAPIASSSPTPPSPARPLAL
jgi:hypothetical protein